MHYSLVNRFQGALLGVALGDCWDQVVQGKRVAPDRLFHPPVPLLISSASVPNPESLPSEANSVGEPLIELIRHLIQIGSSAPSALHPMAGLGASASASQMAILTLPIHLFYHENSQILEQQLSQVLAGLSQASTSYQQVLMVGLLVGQILTHQFHPRSFVAPLQKALPRLLHTRPNPALISALETVQQLLQHRANLQTAWERLASLPDLDPTIALGLYCFLSAPQHLELGILRSARLSYQLPHISALTGMLAGASITTEGLPLAWQAVLTDPAYPLMRNRTGRELRQLATYLLAVWSGAEDPATFSDLGPAIAAPGVSRR